MPVTITQNGSKVTVESLDKRVTVNGSQTSKFGKVFIGNKGVLPLSVDDLGRFYLIQRDNKLIYVDSNGDENIVAYSGEIPPDVVTHITDTTNPHSVTYIQTGAISADSVDTITNKTITDYTNIVHATSVHYRVKNVNGTTLAKGTPVRFSGYNAGEDAIEVVAANQATHVAIGLVEADIGNGSFGQITASGLLEGFDTSAYTAGQILYVDGTGLLTATEPTSGFSQPIAFVLRNHAVNGALQVLAAYPKQDAADVRFDATTSVYDHINTANGANELLRLDGSALVPAGNLPSYVDDVLEYANFAAFPVTGETAKIYIATDTGFQYRWSGSAYIDISRKVDSVNGATGVVVLTADNIADGVTYAIPTLTQESNWDTAYGWGDHSLAGYIVGNQTITLSGDASGSGTTSIVVTVANDSHSHTHSTLPSDILVDTDVGVVVQAYNANLTNTITGDKIVNIDGGAIDGTTIGATTPAAITATTLNTTGNTILGDASTDSVLVNGYMGVGGAGNVSYGVNVVNAALTGSTQVGMYSQITGTSAATSSIRGITARASTTAASFTANEVIGGYFIDAIKGTGSTITNQYGVFVNDQTQGTNNYGITSLVSSGTNKWNIYASGTANNYFAGNLGIGTSSPTEKLTVLGNGQLYVTKSYNQSADISLSIGGTDNGYVDTGKASAWRQYVSGDATGQSLGFDAFLRGTGWTERLRINSSGNVGIGTSSPASWANINTQGTSGATAHTALTMGIGLSNVGMNYSSTSPVISYGIRVEPNAGYGTGLWKSVYSSALPRAAVDVGHSGTIRFYTSASQTVAADADITVPEVMRIDSSGKVGIGTSSPSELLTLSKSGTAGATQLRLKNDTDTTNGLIQFIGSTFATSTRQNALELYCVGADSQQIFYTNSIERMRIDSSGNVGIGNSDPISALAVKTTGTWQNTSIANFNGLAIKHGGYLDTTNRGGLYLTGGNSDNGSNTAFLVYSQLNSAAGASGSNLVISHVADDTGTETERLRINSSGNVGIGTSTANARLQILSALSTVYASAAPSNADCVLSISNTQASESANDHATIQLNVNGGTYNRIGSISAVAESATDRKLALAFCTDNGTARPEVMRIDSSGNVGIGVTPTAGINASLQIKDGINFPATQVASSDANTLDDYEEGTWTPNIVATTDSTGGTYNNRTGRYTKIGNRVFFTAYVNITAHAGSGTMVISGLPFTSANTTGLYGDCAVGYCGTLTLPANSTIHARVATNSTYISLFSTSTAGGSVTSAALALDTAFNLSVSGHYII